MASSSSDSSKRFLGWVVVVTGAGRGIGKSIAIEFSRQGAHVILVGRTKEHLEKVAKAIRKELHEVEEGGEEEEKIVKHAKKQGLPFVVQADVSKKEDVSRLFESIKVRFGGQLNVLVSNAGIAGPTKAVIDIELEEWESVISTNLTGPFLCAQAAAKIMLEDIKQSSSSSSSSSTSTSSFGWNIIHIGSIVSRMPYPLRSPYASSKWGLVGFSHSLAKELGPEGIRVNAILPGPIRGKRLQEVMKNRAEVLGVQPELVAEKLVENTALKRFVEKKEVADVVLSIASSTGITGQAIMVDGGSLML